MKRCENNLYLKNFNYCNCNLESFRGLGKTAEENCLIKFCRIHYMFCISFFHVSLQQAGITTSDHINMIKNYQKTTY